MKHRVKFKAITYRGDVVNKTVKVDGQSYSVLVAERDSRGEYVSLWLDCDTEETAEAESIHRD